MKRVLSLLTLVVLVASLATSGDVDARKKRHHHDRVQTERVGAVRIDYYGNQGLINTFYAVMVSELNAVTAPMPRAPVFWMADRAEKPCSQMPWPVPDNVYQVCTSPYIAGANGLTWSNPVRRAANIQIENSADTWYRFAQIVCHETMHATTGVQDGPTYEAERSCTNGHFNQVGISYLHWWYG